MSRPFSAPKGTVLFRPGQPCPGFLVLTQGSIRVSLTGANGREVVLYRVQPGGICLQTFACLTLDRTYSAEGIVEADITGDLVPPGQFRTRVAEDAAFRDLVFGSVAHRFGEFEQLVEDVALTGFDARLARALLRLTDQGGFVAATHSQLAAETASGRAFVTRRLAEFGKSGLVSQEKGGLRLLDRAGLERIAADRR
ncbi:transcriptional regulator, Crp/Fnr family [Roseibacterium elongatum DSM 19469]|uniref:Transcriptional regulator, Crp/Fnr family n=1 Tax=Roseicyclus elongatus DSM 19469 TaxID=1294273 RepID=W8SLA8_9RHOB|nr:Crp/Fnr family transcriptional regulator [Roseibacterium elongatum]AHM03325.1 transcriptional regulator, Crp/Fnr family [Roseibacterium elongatum DSM 19469]